MTTFQEVGDYITVPAGTYDLEARLANTETVVLSIPGVALAADAVYTAYAMGIVDGEPALQAVLSMDASCSPDIDGDGATTAHDLVLLIAAWGPCVDDGDCGVDAQTCSPRKCSEHKFCFTAP